MIEKCVIEQDQTGAEYSFVGGKPMMPNNADVPICGLCQSELTFFFQFDCEDVEEFSEYILSVFFCTKCQDNEYLIPPMLDGDLKGINVELDFLKNSQVNFSANLWLKSVVSVKDKYQELIKFHTIKNCVKGDSEKFAYVGKNPIWVIDDEMPKTIDGQTSQFLAGFSQDYEFPIIESAPGQVEFDFMEEKNVESVRRSYRLFLANELYFFGTPENKNLIYVITQVD